MTSTLGIAGAGVLGRLLALKFHARGWRVTLFDRDGSGTSACSSVAAGMLAPFCELDVSEKEIAELGANSTALWRELLEQFQLPVYFQQAGSLVVAHPKDREEFQRFKRSVQNKASADDFQEVSGESLKALEPQLDPLFQTGLFFPQEGQIDGRGFLKASGEAIARRGITCHFGTEINAVAAHEIRVANETHRFDMVLDCRGLGAAADMPGLRAVRGELIRVHAPDVTLSRPVRLLHPRYPVYIVPRPDHHFIIGATQIEAYDASPISVRSVLELLSAAYALNAGFSEARIVETIVGLRPAFADNLPRILHQEGLVRVNGLFRHGYLLAPRLTEDICAAIESSASGCEAA